MKKQLISILALMLCLCTVLVMASCGGNSSANIESGSDDVNEESSNGGFNGEETFDAGDGLEDVDTKTAEDIFAQMKNAYKASLGYANAYSVTVEWIENQTNTETGKGADSSTGKTVTKKTLTADPATGNAAEVLTSEEYSGDTKTSTNVLENKIFSENSKNYLYSSSKTDGQLDYDSYSALSAYGLESEKNAMLLSNFFGAGSHFEESFGDPFSAASVSNLKTTYTTVINELKAAEKARYEAMGYDKVQVNATSNIIFNTSDGVDMFKRTITLTCNLENAGGTSQTNITVESLLKAKDGKIISFVSNNSKSTVDKTGESYEAQTNSTSSLSYTFDYAMDNAAYSAIKTTLPTSGAETAPDYFEVPLTLVIGGNEVAINVIGEASATQSVSEILTKTLDELFSDSSIEYDGKWYTDALCKNEFDASTITSVAKLKEVKKLYNKSFKVSSGSALFIDSATVSSSIDKNYTIVFGTPVLSVTDEFIPVSVREYNSADDLVSYRVIYTADTYNTTIEVNGKKPVYNAENPDESEITEEPTGEFVYEFAYDGGKIYFIKRSYVATNSYFTLDSFYVQF